MKKQQHVFNLWESVNIKYIVFIIIWTIFSCWTPYRRMLVMTTYILLCVHDTMYIPIIQRSQRFRTSRNISSTLEIYYLATALPSFNDSKLSGNTQSLIRLSYIWLIYLCIYLSVCICMYLCICMLYFLIDTALSIQLNVWRFWSYR